MEKSYNLSLQAQMKNKMVEEAKKTLERISKNNNNRVENFEDELDFYYCYNKINEKRTERILNKVVFILATLCLLVFLYCYYNKKNRQKNKF